MPADVERLRHEVLAALARRQPVDEQERRDIERATADVARLADPFSRDADPTHVTGSGFVVGPRGVVLLRHLKFDMWLQPGGHIDAGETPWEAARREVIEETGLAVRYLDGEPELAHVSVHDVPNGHVHLDLRYLFDGGDADPAPPPGESEEVRWFAWPAAIRAAEPTLTNILGQLAQRFMPASPAG